LFVTDLAALTLVPPGAWWALSWWIGHDEVDLYVNINTPARREQDRVVAVDLDLDVVRFCDGRVEIVDRDEFEVHQVRYGYPRDVITAAETSATAAYDLAQGSKAPFDGLAALSWIERAQATA
jgi:protein associated with RNAse G/E